MKNLSPVLLMSFNHVQHALVILYKGSTTDMMYSNIAVTLIEQSHII